MVVLLGYGLAIICQHSGLRQNFIYLSNWDCMLNIGDPGPFCLVALQS